jgi:hypothetical protein
MKRMFLYLALALMTVSVYSCSKDEPDLGGTQPGTETEEGGGGGHGNTINPIMTDFNDINQLYGIWTAKERIVGEEEDTLQSPLSVTFKKDGTFVCVFDNTSISGTYTYSNGTAKCTYKSGNTMLIDGYVLTFSPYDDKRLRVETTQHMLFYKVTDCLLMSKTANE